MTRTLIALLLVGCGASATPVETAEDEDDGPPPTFAVALRFEDGGGGEESPRTLVRLVRIAPDGEREVADLGEEAGPCYLDPSGDALVGGRCWWAGTGVRYRVVRRGDRLVASRAEEDADEMPGEFVERGSLEVPSDARIDLLGPSASSQ